METLKNTVLKTGFIICTLLFISCNETKKEDDVMAEEEIPMLEAASQEYLADDVVWYWPDGNSETRHTIEGKEELIAWWKNWKETTDGQMSFTNNTFLPLKVNKPSNYYKLVGTGVLAYTDLTISIQDKTTSVRQHMVFMFDENKKINHALLYYDRTGIVELTNVVFGNTE